jgi:hypothetical protein
LPDNHHVGGSDEDYYNGNYLRDILEADLLELGGQELLDTAHDEAARHVDKAYLSDRCRRRAA